MSETLQIQETKRAWAIFYRIRISSKSKWGSWIGPCGIYAMRLSVEKDSFGCCPINPKMSKCLSGRPFLFHTRKQARDRAKELDKRSNLTWTWTHHTVRPVKLTYEVL